MKLHFVRKYFCIGINESENFNLGAWLQVGWRTPEVFEITLWVNLTYLHSHLSIRFWKSINYLKKV